MDQTARLLERRAAGGDDHAAALALATAVRVGEKARSSLRVAAIMGHGPAQALFPEVDWGQAPEGAIECLAVADQAHGDLCYAWATDFVRAAVVVLGRRTPGLGLGEILDRGGEREDVERAIATTQGLVHQAMGHNPEGPAAGVSAPDALAAADLAQAVCRILEGNVRGAVEAVVGAHCSEERVFCQEGLEVARERELDRLRHSLIAAALEWNQPLWDEALGQRLVQSAEEDIRAHVEERFESPDFEMTHVELDTEQSRDHEGEPAFEANVDFVGEPPGRGSTPVVVIAQVRLRATWDWGWIPVVQVLSTHFEERPLDVDEDFLYDEHREEQLVEQMGQPL